jgi:hypothetical protein
MRTRIAIASFLALALAAAAMAEDQQAVFAEVNGKVEYQVGGADWTPARPGDAIGAGVVVSTGFKSSATLKIGTATISVKPITRLTLQELIKTSGGTQTKLFLLSGRVKADIPKEPGKTIDFKVKSPTATASVRGTSFEFDGVNLLVDRGSVQLATPTFQFRNVAAGEFSNVTTGGVVPPPAAVSVETGLSQVGELVSQAQAESLAPAAAKPQQIVSSDMLIPLLSVSIQ